MLRELRTALAPLVWGTSYLTTTELLPPGRPLFAATVQATEEAVINAMVAAETMTGVNGNTVYAIPHDRLREAMRKYNRLSR